MADIKYITVKIQVNSSEYVSKFRTEKMNDGNMSKVWKQTRKENYE
jgi:hypothetical protein